MELDGDCHGGMDRWFSLACGNRRWLDGKEAVTASWRS